jgi:hypothetical protein
MIDLREQDIKLSEQLLVFCERVSCLFGGASWWRGRVGIVVEEREARLVKDLQSRATKVD